jgi:hypothetical protein
MPVPVMQQPASPLPVHLCRWNPVDVQDGGVMTTFVLERCPDCQTVRSVTLAGRWTLEQVLGIRQGGTGEEASGTGGP